MPKGVYPRQEGLSKTQQRAHARGKHILSTVDIKNAERDSTLVWAFNRKIILTGGLFSIVGHEYQADWLAEDHKIQSWKKGAQLGITEVVGVLKTLHGQVMGKYPQGVLYLLPTRTDVIDFSKGRFSTLISENPDSVGKFVRDTDAANVKRIEKSMLYLRGAKASHKIEGMKATSSQLKNIPVDCIVFDEKDEMSPDMVRLAEERLSHSKVQEMRNISTPTIPGYGIDKDYQNSDQRVWLIKCGKCGHETCLELAFPDCLIRTKEYGVIRICTKCKNAIYPKNGRWVAQRPERSKDHVGWWISQLNSQYISPGKILDEFLNPTNVTEFYNSKLGMAHIEAENKLTTQDIYATCGQNYMSENNVSHHCAMGVDVGRHLHFVIGYPKTEKHWEILKIGRVSGFNDLHNLATLFNVKCMVIDALPETRKVREFQQAEPFKVFLCYYQDTLKNEMRLDEQQGIVAVNRTEICDETHQMFTNSQVIIPRRSNEIEQFATEMCNIAKVLEEDEFTKSRKYKYRNLGPDHYRHAMNYFKIACKDNGVIYQPKTFITTARKAAAEDWSPF